MMEYRKLGTSDLKVSTLCLGTTMFGTEIKEPVATHLIAQARDAGVNFLDTADVYSDGRSEEVIGRLIAPERNNWVLATKVASPVGPGPYDRGCSRQRIVDGIGSSLRRLRTDCVDIYYLHREDHTTPLEETVRALGDLIAAGKIRHFGLSNYRSWRIAEICRLCDAMGIARPIACEPYYNALNRMPEVEVLPACAYYGLGVVPYSPLARGVLTGKYRPDASPPADSRIARQDNRMLETEWRPESLIIAQEIRRHAERRGITAGQFAVRWVLNNRIVTAVIAGPRTPQQWEEYIEALNYRFTADDEALVDRLVVTGHSSTPGYNDPKYPIEGRMTYTAADQTKHIAQA